MINLHHPHNPEKTHKLLWKFCVVAGSIFGAIAGLVSFVINDFASLAVEHLFSLSSLLSLVEGLFVSLICLIGFAMFGALLGSIIALPVFHIIHCMLYLSWPDYKESCRYRNDYILERPFWSLIALNIITIVWGVAENWSLSVIAWLYCFHNLIVGFIWGMRLFLKDFFLGMQFSISYSAVHVAAGFFLYKWNMPIPMTAFMAAALCLVDQSYSYWCTRDSNFWDTNKDDIFPMPWHRVNFMIFFLVVAYLLKIIFNVNFEILSRFSVFIFLAVKMFIDLITYSIHRENVLLITADGIGNVGGNYKVWMLEKTFRFFRRMLP